MTYTRDREFFDRVYPFLRKASDDASDEEVEREREFLFSQMYPEHRDLETLIEVSEAKAQVETLKRQYMETIDRLLVWRNEFRGEGNWEMADMIRDLLADSGIKIRDKMGGSYWEWDKD